MIDMFGTAGVSHPMRMRGLKYYTEYNMAVDKVASHADAWIEMLRP